MLQSFFWWENILFFRWLFQFLEQILEYQPQAKEHISVHNTTLPMHLSLSLSVPIQSSFYIEVGQMLSNWRKSDPSTAM